MSQQYSSEDQVAVLVDALLPREQAEKIRRLSPRIELIEGLSEVALRKAQVIYTHQAPFDPADAPDLRWVQVSTAGVDYILNRPVAHSGIPITNVRGAYTLAVAELAIGMLLAMTRRFPVSRSLQLRSKWPEDSLTLQGENCHGKTMGIIGYGSIGRHVARIAQAMGIKVLACKRRPDVKQEATGFRLPNTGDAEGAIPEAWFGPEQIHQMLRGADFAVVALPLTSATRGLIGKRELEALPAHAYVINVGRGPVIDEAALIDCLQAGRLAGAGLDVFASEPLVADSPLWKRPNVIVMPHRGSWTKEQVPLAVAVLIENLSRDLAHRPLINLVDMEAGY